MAYVRFWRRSPPGGSAALVLTLDKMGSQGLLPSRFASMVFCVPTRVNQKAASPSAMLFTLAAFDIDAAVPRYCGERAGRAPPTRGKGTFPPVLV
jgi:hypothetical protein